MDSRVELARQQWAESHRDLTSQPAGDDRVNGQVESVMIELRRRVGASFTLAQLAAVYDDSERWTLAAIAERDGMPGWARTASAASGAAFHLYARGARDYRP